MRRLLLLPAFLLFSVSLIYAQGCCPGFEAAFTYYPTQTENRIEFEFTSNANYDFIVWNFGDGQTSNLENPDHIYGAAGIYQVCVVIESNAGCRSELCHEVAVETTDDCNDFLADFLWGVNPSNSLGVQFENISLLEADYYIWNFGDGNSSSDAEPYHEFAEEGMYQVCLVLETNAGCRSEYCVEVCVEDPAPEPPTAENCCLGFEAWFSYYPTQTENRIEFENQSAGEWDYIVWDFGDGETSTQEHPDHIYGSAGIYQVCMVIESDEGCRSELCYEVAVETSPDPCNDFLADFVWVENIDSLGIQFEEISPITPDYFVWHFGDGSSSTDSDPYHQYSEPGVYQVCLVVENNDGCRSEFCRSVCVEDFNPCAEFGVEFEWSEGFNNGLLIEFDGAYSGFITSIEWDFGDGSTSTAEHPDHEYAQPGIYEVCVNVENNDGCSSQYCVSVAVEQQTDPCENFEADFLYFVDLENGGVHFEDLSSGTIHYYNWYFGDGSISTEEEPTHHYSETGVFEACLVIENEFGCIAEYCQPVFLPSYYFWVAPPTVGIEEQKPESLVVYPNPFQDFLRFQVPIDGMLEVMDMQGKVVSSRRLSGTNSVNLNSVSAGLYVVRITENESISTVRVVKY